MKKAIRKKNSILKTVKTEEAEEFPQKKNDLFVVGIGASAGGLEALKLFFDNAPSNSGMAFIIVQHLDPTHKSLLSELLSEHTKMKVREITDGMMVNRDCVYIIPPNKDLKIFNSSLQLTEPAEARAKRKTIDCFFYSLAKDKQEKAIGIVLSGTGTEGTLGLKEIKAEGGLALVQDPKSAQFAGMPQSAIIARTADYILTPEKMPAQLVKFIKKRSSGTVHLLTELTPPVENQLKKIFLIIRNQTGYDFSNYKTNTILRRISKRASLSQIDSIDDYIHFLQNNPSEIEKLYKDFLIGVTSFFRDKGVFKSVEKKAIPHLLEICKDRQEIRIWVCGCSTGEEAYSLAILLKEALEKKKQYTKVMIFASDIDKDAIEFARAGTYSESLLGEVSSHRISQYFIRKENGFQLKKEIREMVVFAHHNVIKDPPFSKMDMISCRNLLIYMNSDLQKRIIPIFHYSLNSEGILLLGTSESIGEYGNFFSALDLKEKIYKKNREIIIRKPSTEYEFPVVKNPAIISSGILTVEPRKKINISTLSEKILLGNYAFR